MEEKKKQRSLAEILAGCPEKKEEMQPDRLSNLLAGFSYKKVEQYFLDQVVYIDDYTFEKCRFDRCRLITFKGTFKFTNCVISANTIIEYGGDAFKVAKLFNSMAVYGDSYPNFKVTINTDGTITLE